MLGTRDTGMIVLWQKKPVRAANCVMGSLLPITSWIRWN